MNPMRRLLLSCVSLAMIGGLSAASSAIAEQVMRRDLGVELKTLDVQKMHLLAEQEFAADLFNGLLVRDMNGDLQPGVAESWEISDDGKTYTFHLADTLWSNGDPVKASDFVFALRRILSPETAASYSSFLFPIAGAREYNSGENSDPASVSVNAPDDKTLVIELTSPTPYFLDLMATVAAVPLHEASVTELGSAYSEPGNMISNGAYMLTESKPTEYVILDKNPNYKGAEDIPIDRVYYYQVTDEATAVRMFRAGDLDITRGSQGDNNAWAVENMPEAVQSATILGTEYYDFGTATPELSDPRVRKAISMVIDRVALTEDILQTGEEPAFGLVPPGLAGYENPTVDWADLSYVERVEQARALMEEAGFGPDKQLEININFNSSETHRKTAVAMADMLREIYVVAAPYNRDSSAYWDWLYTSNGEFGLARDSWLADYPDPMVFLNQYIGEPGFELTGYRNPEFDALIATANEQLDPAVRMKMLAEAEQMLLDDNVIIPLYNYKSVRLVNPAVTGWVNNAFALHPTQSMAFE